MNLNYAEGLYNLSFFNIIIKTEEELSKEVIEKNKSTFVHEFIHYLQDLILPYNIRYILSNVRWFFNILESAHKDGNISRPFNRWSDESGILRMQFNRSFGGIAKNKNERFINVVSKIGDATFDCETFSGFDGYLQIPRTHNVYRYFLPVYEINNSTPINYNLGARDILEYIAYKIELKNFPDRPAAPDLPYKSIDLIFDKYGLSHVPDDIRLCVAERCLYNDTPIHYLLSHLSDDKFKKIITDSSYEEIYNYLLELDTVTRDGHSESLANKTQRRLKQFADELRLQYSGFDEIQKWILRINDFVEHELSKRFIFSEMYKMESDEFHKFVDLIINYIGVPIIMNVKGEYISILPDEIEVSQFIHFYILQGFINFATSNMKHCPIYNFCMANGGTCNENCILNPQVSIRESKNCYYNKFLELYGLSDVVFK